MKTYGGIGSIAQPFLASALDGVFSFTPRPLYPQGNSPWIVGWVGPRAGLDAEVKRKILSPCRDPNPRSSSL